MPELHFPLLNFLLLLFLLILLGVHFSSYRIASWMDERVDVVRQVLRGKKMMELEVTFAEDLVSALLPTSPSVRKIKLRLEGEVLNNELVIRDISAIRLEFVSGDDPKSPDNPTENVTG